MKKDKNGETSNMHVALKMRTEREKQALTTNYSISSERVSELVTSGRKERVSSVHH